MPTDNAMHILFLSRWFPYPPDNGARIRILNLLRLLAVEHTVDLVSFVSEPVHESSLAALRTICRRVEMFAYRPFRPNSIRTAVGFFSRRPRSVIDTYSAEMAAAVQRLHEQQAYDVVIASEFDMAPYAQILPETVVKIWEDIELAVIYENYNRQSQPLQRLRHGLTWWKTASYTKKTLHSFHACSVVTEEESRIIKPLRPAGCPIAVVPNGVDVAAYAADFGPPTPDTLVYPGALTYHANLNAMIYFIGEILPRIQAERPNVTLTITGRTDGVALQRLPQNDGVFFTGYLEDIRPTVAQSWCCIVPLRVGGGSRLKILESLALGTPVVSTSKGAEGLSLTPGADLLMGDSAGDFAAATLRLLGDASLRASLSRQGRETVTAQYDWQGIGQKLRSFVAAVQAGKATA